MATSTSLTLPRSALAPSPHHQRTEEQRQEREGWRDRRVAAGAATAAAGVFAPVAIISGISGVVDITPEILSIAVLVDAVVGAVGTVGTVGSDGASEILLSTYFNDSYLTAPGIPLEGDKWAAGMLLRGQSF